MSKIKLLDCTLRDGGYYNSWDFDINLIQDYLKAMDEISVDYVELGLRGFSKDGFKGACAYTTDNFINSLEIPENLNIGVMVNASDLVNHPGGVEAALSKLFAPASESPVSLVRVACHVHEFEKALPASNWLKEQGYIVGFNLMQIADRSVDEIKNLASLANDYSLDVLYFADSLGSLNPEKTSEIIQVIREVWEGPMGIHTHDNMGYALANSMRAVEESVTWIDGTVTGMGRGPGNAKTEYAVIELDNYRNKSINITPLLEIIRKNFHPMQQKYGWGTNTYYYLAGKFGIHPTYIQEMINDSRYDEKDILSVIDHLKLEGGKKFNFDTLEAARNFFMGDPVGTWNPAVEITNREVIILGTGPGIVKHKEALEEYIRVAKPYVIALNTQEYIKADLIDIRAACHPVRLMADYYIHTRLPQPLATPISMLDDKIIDVFKEKEIKDFGIKCEENTFKFEKNYCTVPTALVIAYALSIATSGNASKILLAGFDGYSSDDSRNMEMNELLMLYANSEGARSIVAITPTRYQIEKTSVYQLIGEYVK
ncbi:aldolase catalytic domain-containing protein [Sporosarcina psychrophila]|uniref:aldolase catalytic domain-containing protein n=1 Tax=Sporosarcina psychrophila TaxID=1476 RepID=UPI00078B31A8|nr:aldolase catalytic domain-containing protein [Sporosarcina psychrophila]AMQ07884.1 aldolase [Sporosarcina psychrophila]